MPHFGLLDPDTLDAEAAALQRARLHIRAGRRRLRQGKISHGLGSLFDALLFALQWYIASPDRRKILPIKKEDDLRNDRLLFSRLVEAGVLDGRFDYDAFDNLVETAPTISSTYDYAEPLRHIESVMTRLGVMPFDEREVAR